MVILKLFFTSYNIVPWFIISLFFPDTLVHNITFKSFIFLSFKNLNVFKYMPTVYFKIIIWESGQHLE